MAWLTKVNPFKGSGAISIARKDAVSAPISAVPANSLFAALFSNVEITPYQAWGLYKNSAALAKVIDLIADEVARLLPQVKINGEIVEDHPILMFLDDPGFNRTRQRLIKEMAVQYLVTGTSYVIPFGNTGIADLPIALDVAQTFRVSHFEDFDMWPRSYMYSNGTVTQNFQRDYSNPRNFRWLGVDEGMALPPGVSLSEIVPIYDLEGDRRGIGMPRLNAIKYDVELRLKGIMHNSALMNNGARPSGVLNVKDVVDEEQFRALENDLNARLAGPENSGRVFITGGGEMEFTALSQSAKDMDFVKLIEVVEDAIVSRYNVPITLFRTTAQTNNNYETAWKFFYNLAALPCFEVIYSGLAQMFTRRLGTKVEIVHDKLSNPVLQEQAIKQATGLYGAHLVSRNEAREIFGYEPVLGGDTLYGSISDVPQGEDYFTNHGINDPEADNSREAYHAVRPENDPIQQAGAEAEARAAGAARGNPDKDKPKKPDKKSAKSLRIEREALEAKGILIEFAKYLEKASRRAA